MRGYCSIFTSLLLLWLRPMTALQWTPSSLPNPMHSPAACGREGVLRSAICDPENLLSKAEKDGIEGVINMIHNGEEPFGTRTAGMQVAVVMVGGIDYGFSPETFTRGVHDAWGVGDKHRNDGVVVMVAFHDREIYISVGDGVPAMTSAAIEDTVDLMKAPLRAGQKGKALQDAVMRVGAHVAGTAPVVEPKKAESAWPIVLVILAIAGTFIYCSKNSVSATSRLQRLRNDVAAAHRNEYRAASCPICFDDFVTPNPRASDTTTNATEAVMESADSPPASRNAEEPASGNPRRRTPLSLPCGHAFCEPCLEEWLKSHTNCPICRHDCFPGERPPQPPQQPDHPSSTSRRPRMFGNRSGTMCSAIRSFQRGPQVIPPMGWGAYHNEFDYRLSRLRTMYPSEITAQTADTLRNRAAEGPAAFSQAVDAEVRRLAASRGSSGSRSRSFGGGRSSRGGGGRF